MNKNTFAGRSTMLTLFALGAQTATANGDAVDLVDYDGNAALIFQTAAPSGTDTPTMALKLQHSADGSTSWADVSGATATYTAAGVDKIVVNTDKCRRYVRAVATISGTNPSFTCAATLLALPRG